MGKDALIAIIDKIVLFLVGLPAIIYIGTTYSLLAAFVSAAAAVFLVAVFWSIKNISPGVIKPKFSGWGKWIPVMLPFGLSAACSVIFCREDTVMLYLLADAQETGRYRAAFRLMEGLFLFPQLVTIAAYPVLSRWYVKGLNTNKIISNLTKHLLTVSLLISVGGISLSKPLMKLLFPEYSGISEVFVFLLWSLPITYLNYFFGTILASCDRQMRIFIGAFVSMIVNFLLNYWWIPIWGAAGAAMATLATQFIYCTFLVYSAPFKPVEYKVQSYLFPLLMVLLVEGLVLYFVKDTAIWISLPTGIITGLSCLLLFRIYTFDELRHLKESLKGSD